MRTKAIKLITRTKRRPILGEAFRFVMIMVGAILMGVGLEGFLIPNGFLDGGITGISIILSTLFGIPMGALLALLNAPFVVLAWFKAGKREAVRIAVGVATLAAVTLVLHDIPAFTTEFFLALAYGGALMGLGVGLALRQGGALDGTDALASILADRSRYSVDQLILAVNIAIFIVAGFVMGAQEALASAALFYLAVAPMISKVVDGGSTVRRAAW